MKRPSKEEMKAIARDLANCYYSKYDDGYHDYMAGVIDGLNYVYNTLERQGLKIMTGEEYRKEIKKSIQENCDHDFGPVTWTWSCGGYRVCNKCGKHEDYYERD